MDIIYNNYWQLCRTIGPLTLHSQEMYVFNKVEMFSLSSFGADCGHGQVVQSIWSFHSWLCPS